MGSFILVSYTVFISPADVLLSGEINIKVSLSGFPTPVTSALSLPAPQSPNTYQHFVFSGRKYRTYLDVDHNRKQ